MVKRRTLVKIWGMTISYLFFLYTFNFFIFHINSFHPTFIVVVSVLMMFPVLASGSISFFKLRLKTASCLFYESCWNPNEFKEVCFGRVGSAVFCCCLQCLLIFNELWQDLKEEEGLNQIRGRMIHQCCGSIEIRQYTFPNYVMSFFIFVAFPWSLI